MSRLFKFFVVALLFVTVAAAAHAQKVGIKTNVLYWAAGGTINLGGEFALGPKLTLDLGATGNPWVFGKKELNRKFWHWSANGEIRFWQWEKFNRGFVGVHLLGGSYSAGGIDLPMGIFPELKSHRYEGWMAGLGVSYGWQWYLSPHWNLEATFGFGYIMLNYNRFGCRVCDAQDQTNVVHHYFGPTKLGVSFMYLFGSKK